MDEHGVGNHPELMDPEWQRYVEEEAQAGLQRHRRRARRGRRFAIFAVVLVVVGGAGFACYHWGKAATQQDAGPTGAPPAVTTTTTVPTDLPGISHVDLAKPFDNTPAQDWAEGIAGLAVPPASRVGEFSAQQVSSALEQVERAITVARFDQNTLVAHDPVRYANLLAPDARQQVLAHATDYLTYLADGYHLLPVQPRMTGSLTVRAGGTGELVVHAGYVIAYAFDPGDAVITAPGDIDPFIRDDTDYVVRTGAHWKASSRGLWPDSTQGFYTEAACDSLDKGVIAPAYSDQRTAIPSFSQQPGQFDPGQALPTEGNC